MCRHRHSTAVILGEPCLGFASTPAAGQVGAGDDIVEMGEATERMTVAEINALLYSSDHPRDRLERAVRIAAPSPGWHVSFEALLHSDTGAAEGGNAGLAPAAAAHPGFNSLAVMAIGQDLVEAILAVNELLTGFRWC